MKTAYTPGPWSVGQTREIHGYPTKAVETLVCVGEGATQGNAIARVGLGGPGATRYTAESVEANARLIAAAPELLEALQKLCPLTHRDTCKGLQWGPMAKEEREQDCDCGAALARKAIAKATEGTP